MMTLSQEFRTCCFETFDARIDVSCNDATLLGDIERYFTPTTLAADGPKSEFRFRVSLLGDAKRQGEYRIDRDGSPAMTVQSRELALDRVLSDMHHTVGRNTRYPTFVHASVVEYQERAIVIPGRSHAGKSRLAAALVQAGATYYSDEYALIDSHGMVHPYAKPLGLRPERGIGAKRYLTAQELGGSQGVRPVRIGLVAALQYRENSVWSPLPLSRAQALLSLLDNAVRVREFPDETLAALSAALTDDVVALRGERPDAAITAGRLLSWCPGGAV